MRAVFPASPRGVLVSSFGRPVCSVAEWVPHSVVFASGVDSVCDPLANEGVGLGPSSSGPVASRPPLGIGLLQRPRGDAFQLGVSMRWSSTHGGLASGSSRSQASRYGLLVYVQGAADSMPRSSPEGEVMASGFWHSGTGVAPGNVPSSWHGCLPGAGSVFVRLYLLRIVSLSLRFCSEVPGPPVSRSPEFLCCSRNFLWYGGPVQFVTLPGGCLWFFRAWLGLGGAPLDIRCACFLF